MKNKCKDCQDRVVGCHSFCDYYKEFREKLDAITKRERAEREKYYQNQVWNFSNRRKHR